MLRRCPSYLPDLYLWKWIPGSFTFHGSEVGLNNQLFHRSSFPPFLKTEVIFIFFQCSGISPRIHDLGKTIGNGLTMAQPAPSAPMGASYHVPQTKVCPVCWSVLLRGHLPQRQSHLCLILDVFQFLRWKTTSDICHWKVLSIYSFRQQKHIRSLIQSLIWSRSHHVVI